MFEVGFGEIALIAVVALLVLGPERLPGVARTVGALVRRARASWQSVRSEIERELAGEDIKKNLDEARRAAADVRSDVQSAASDIEKSSTMPPPGSSSHGGPCPRQRRRTVVPVASDRASRTTPEGGRSGAGRAGRADSDREQALWLACAAADQASASG